MVMARPKCPRCVGLTPEVTYFKPRGIPLPELEEVVLGVDEMEALRLADLQGLYQEPAARAMKVSRATFGRIVEAARRKVADALVNSKAIRIEGGVVQVRREREFRCAGCGHEWREPFGTGRPGGCPSCGGNDFFRKATGTDASSRGTRKPGA